MKKLNPIIEKMKAGSGRIALTWLGNLSWLIYADNIFFAFDLDLEMEMRIKEPHISSEEIAEVLDLLLITHEHGDHFNVRTVSKLVSLSDCSFIIPQSCMEKAHETGIPEDRSVVVKPGMDISLKEMQIMTFRALHGDRHGAVYRYASLEDCGYMVSVAGKTFFQPGDTVLLQEHLELQDVDILFVSPTEHNMQVADSKLLIETLDPAIIIPQHFDTYTQQPDNLFWTKGYVDELKNSLDVYHQEKFHKLNQGEVFYVPD